MKSVMERHAIALKAWKTRRARMVIPRTLTSEETGKLEGKLEKVKAENPYNAHGAQKAQYQRWWWWMNKHGCEPPTEKGTHIKPRSKSKRNHGNTNSHIGEGRDWKKGRVRNENGEWVKPRGFKPGNQNALKRYNGNLNPYSYKTEAAKYNRWSVWMRKHGRPPPEPVGRDWKKGLVKDKQGFWVKPLIQESDSIFENRPNIAKEVFARVEPHLEGGIDGKKGITIKQFFFLAGTGFRLKKAEIKAVLKRLESEKRIELRRVGKMTHIQVYRGDVSEQKSGRQFSACLCGQCSGNVCFCDRNCQKCAGRIQASKPHKQLLDEYVQAMARQTTPLTDDALAILRRAKASETAKKAWRTKRARGYGSSKIMAGRHDYDAPKKNGFRDVVIASFAGIGGRCLALESPQWLFVKGMAANDDNSETSFLIYENDTDTYQRMSTNRPQVISKQGSLQPHRLEIVFDDVKNVQGYKSIQTAFLDYCKPFRVLEDDLKTMKDKLSTCDKIALTFSLRDGGWDFTANRKENGGDYRFELVARILSIFDNFTVEYGTSYRDSMSMVGIILVRKDLLPRDMPLEMRIEVEDKTRKTLVSAVKFGFADGDTGAEIIKKFRTVLDGYAKDKVYVKHGGD